MKDSFIFHLENFEDLEDLTHEEIGIIFLAMIRFTETGEEPEFEDKLLRAAWKPLRRRLKADEEYYNDLKEKRSEAGKKGGAPKGNQNAKKEESAPEPEKTTSETSKNQAKTSKTSKTTKTSYTDLTTDLYTDTDLTTDLTTDLKPYIPTGKAHTHEEPATRPSADPPSPTFDNVIAYFKQTNSKVDPLKFYEYYGCYVGLLELDNWQEAADRWTKSEYPKARRRR